MSDENQSPCKRIRLFLAYQLEFGRFLFKSTELQKIKILLNLFKEHEQLYSTFLSKLQ